jgi:hypothetical protein
LTQGVEDHVADICGMIDKPRWDINIFGEEAEKGARHQVVLSV